MRAFTGMLGLGLVGFAGGWAFLGIKAGCCLLIGLGGGSLIVDALRK